MKRYAVVIEMAGANFSAYIPDIPGCVATGVTAVEIEENIREAVRAHIDGLLREGLAIPEAYARTTFVEVELELVQALPSA